MNSDDLGSEPLLSDTRPVCIDTSQRNEEECNTTMLLENNMECSYEDGELNSRRKRGREIDENELWFEVGRRGKTIALSEENQEFSRRAEEKIEVSLNSYKEKLPKQIALARILKTEKIMNITNVKYLNPYKVLLRFSSEEDAEKLIQCKYFMNQGYRCQKTYEVNMSYGVIRDIETELTETDILENLSSDIQILNVKRLQRFDLIENLWKNSESVRLCFKGSLLPTYILTHNTRIKVTPYVFPVSQCTKCWKFGHTKRVCPSRKIICPKCTGPHENCESTTYRCPNCSGKHMALAKSCPLYLKEKKLREIMAEYNCSYKKAISVYVPPSPARKAPQMEKYTQESRDFHLSEHYLRRDISPVSTSVGSPTYAQVTKVTAMVHEEKRKKVEKKKEEKKTKRSNFSSERDTMPCESVEQDVLRCNREPTIASNEEQNSKASIWSILLRLKEILFMKTLSFEDKVKKFGSIIIEEVVKLLTECFSECSWIKYFIHNG